MYFKDISGQTFHRWLVLRFDKKGTYGLVRGQWLVECQCEDRPRRHQTATDLKTGKSKSCGCLQREGLQKSSSPNTERTTLIAATEHQIIEGLLLSDAGIAWVSKRSVVLQFGNVSKLFVDHVEATLPFDFQHNVRPERKQYIAGSDKISTCKPFYVIASPVDRSLLEYESRWYTRNPTQKLVPNDLIFTPLVLLYWFLGDGSTSWSHNEASVVLKLHTNGFQWNECQKLVIALNQLDADMHFTIERSALGHLVIKSARGETVRAFLKYIGDCPKSIIEEMGYKWKIPTSQPIGNRKIPGSPCRNCGSTTRYISGACGACRTAYMRQWRAAKKAHSANLITS